MSILDNIAHGLLVVLATFARLVLGTLDFIERILRNLMSGAGLNSDMQTILLIVLLTVFLFGTLRLMKGRIRTTLTLTIILVLAHTLGGIAHGPVT